MKNPIAILLFVHLFALNVFAEIKVMYPGETHGQLIVLSQEDVLDESEKYQALTPISIPVFPVLPAELSAVAGAITLAEQGQLSHVQLKARANKMPNIDISDLEDGISNPVFNGAQDGDYIHIIANADGTIEVNPSSKSQAEAFYKEKLALNTPVELSANLEDAGILHMADVSWQDYEKVGSKAANYAELGKALNTSERTVVKPSMAIPFYYYDQFIVSNPILKNKIASLMRDPFMKIPSGTAYRAEKLQEVRDMIGSKDLTIIDPAFLLRLLEEFDSVEHANGDKVKLKLRSSTNAEDLPSFNGAGLYTSKSYKPMKGGKEKSQKKKLKSLSEALRTVWASVWNLRAFEERELYSIDHSQVYMGVQVNPSFPDEDVDGVVVTKNIANDNGPGVYIESQRGDEHSVANPAPGVHPEKVLVYYDEANPLDKASYTIEVLGQSNIGDDNKTVLESPNPNPVMSQDEIKDLVFQSLKAQQHFQPIFGSDEVFMPLDLEFKVDSQETGQRQVYLKQARPFIY